MSRGDAPPDLFSPPFATTTTNLSGRCPCLSFYKKISLVFQNERFWRHWGDSGFQCLDMMGKKLQVKKKIWQHGGSRYSRCKRNKNDFIPLPTAVCFVQAIQNLSSPAQSRAVSFLTPLPPFSQHTPLPHRAPAARKSRRASRATADSGCHRPLAYRARSGGIGHWRRTDPPAYFQ